MNKGNINNLIPLTTDKAREIGIKGGITSGKVRAERKKLRECFEILLSTETEDKDGVLTGIERLALATYKKAIQGDIRAIEFIRGNVGETPPKNEISDNTEAELNNSISFNF